MSDDAEKSAQTTFGEWRMHVLLLLVGPDDLFQSGVEAIRPGDEDILKKLWDAGKHPAAAADEYYLAKTGLAPQVGRLTELVERLAAPGRPGDSLSASEFAELSDGMLVLIDERCRLGLSILEFKKVSKPTTVVGSQIREVIKQVRDRSMKRDSEG